MMDSLADKLPEIVKWVESNPLIVTLTSGGAVVWLFANLKGIVNAVINAVVACISFTITNTYEDNRGQTGSTLKLRQVHFNNLLTSSKPLWERTVNVDLSNAFNKDAVAKDSSTAIVMDDPYTTATAVNVKSSVVNTYGFSIRILLGKIAVVNRSYKLDGQRITMNSTIRVFFARKKAFMAKLEKEISDRILASIASEACRDSISVWNGETFGGTKFKRSLDSIFTKNDVHKELLDSIESFISNKETYKKLNYPYNYCALLYGVPGSGKTSTILAVASKLNRNVFYVNLASTNVASLLRALNDEPDKNIYVFEDIDAVSFKNADTRESQEGKQDSCRDANAINMSKLFGMSLSDLLNITDGLLASDGTICIFTTNHVEKLDPAFLRAGRMNKSIEFTYMAPDVSKRMVEAYLDVSIDNMIDNIKPAELQECILDVLLKKKTIEDLKEKFCCHA